MTCSSAPPRPAITSRELAHRLGVKTRKAGMLLASCVACGLVEKDRDGYRLTAETERTYGRAFRGLPHEDGVPDEDFALHRRGRVAA